MIVAVVLAQVADLAGYLVVVEDHPGEESNLLMAGLSPELVIAAKLIGLVAVVVGIRALPRRLGRLVGGIAIGVGLLGAASAIAVMA